MAKNVRLNVDVRISGKVHEAGEELAIDDHEFKVLSTMSKMGQPYLTEIVAEKAPVEADAEKPQRKRKAKKETATLLGA